jgi:3-phenylpropionate/trans-cinnamate dioxygenase ferredoxin subunit
LPKENEMRFVDVGPLDAIAPGKSHLVSAAGRSIALFNIGGEVHALDDACPHSGSSLAAGEIDGCRVKCRAHGWRFDIATGELVVAPSIKTARHPVKIADGRVLVALDA